MGKEGNKNSTLEDRFLDAQKKKAEQLRRQGAKEGKQKSKKDQEDELLNFFEEAKTNPAEKADDAGKIDEVKKDNNTPMTAEKEDEMKKAEIVRPAAEYTIDKIEKYEDINADTEGKSDEKFIELTRKLWKEFAVHGLASFDENGKIFIKKETDLDGDSALYMLKLAGLDVSDVEYKAHSEFRKGGVTVDASGRDGVSTPDQGESLVVDHHGKESKRDSSATKHAYDLLIEYGLLEKNETLEKFVNLVTDEDNANYTKEEIDRLFDPKTTEFSRTLIGLSRYLRKTPEKIIEILEKVDDYKAELPAEILKEFKGKDSYTKKEKTLEAFGKEDLERRIKESEKAIKSMEAAGFVIESGNERFGKILIDTGKGKLVGDGGKAGYANKVAEGFLPVRKAGYGSYVVYIKEQGRFKIYTEEPLGDIEFDKGFPVRTHFWNAPYEEGKDFNVTLEEIISKLCGDNFKIGNKFKEVIDKEAKNIDALKSEAEKNRKWMEALREKIDSDYFDKNKYGVANSKKAKELDERVGKAVRGRIGVGKEFAYWNKKKSILEGLEKQINAFVAKMEKIRAEKEKEKNELTSREKEYVGAYVTVVEKVREEMKKHFSEENGYTSSEIPGSIKTEEERFWRYVLLNKIKEGKRIDEDRIPLFIEEIKKQAEKK